MFKMKKRSMSTSDDSYPIVSCLSEYLCSFAGKERKPTDYPIYRAVLDYGLPYAGIKRPKGYAKMKARSCFGNAAILALEERGTYVEGFAMSFDQPPIHHAWITRDEKHAIDITLPNAAAWQYFGISFPRQIVGEYVQRRGYADKLLEPSERAVFQELLSKLPFENRG